MSVINKVLQDLEQRQDQPVVSRDYVQSKKTSPFFMWVLMAITLSSVGVAIWLTPAKEYVFQYIPFLFEEKNNSQDDKSIVSGQASDSSKPSFESIAVDAVKYKINAVVGDKNITGNLVSEVSVMENSITSQAKQMVDEHHQVSGSDIASKKGKPVETQLKSMEQGNGSRPNTDSLLNEQNVENKPMLAKDDTDSTGEFSIVVSQPTKAQILADLKSQAGSALAQDNHQEAIELLEQLLQVEPQNINARKQLIAVYFAQNQTTTATKLLNDAVALFPKVVDFKVMLARLYQSQGRLQEGLVALNSSQIQPDSAEFYEIRAVLAQQLENYSQSKADYLQLAAFEPTVAKWWLGHAISADKLGEIETARSSYIKASALSQLNSEVEGFIQQRLLVLGGLR